MNLRRGLVVVGLSWLALVGGAQAASASNLSYWGGPVAHATNVILVQWGSHVRTTYTDPTSGDPAFFQYLASQSGSTTDIGGVLAQYMDTSGQNSANHITYGGSVQVSPSVGATGGANVQESDIQNELGKDISAGTLPTPGGDGPSTIYVVLLPPGDNVCFDGGTCSNHPTDGFCAFHGSFQPTGSSHVLYAAIPDNGPGSANYGLCGDPSKPDINNQTAVVGHEFAETINDPLVGEATTLGPPLGWYDMSFSAGGEIADKCNAVPFTTNGPWTVEPLWSNKGGACVGGEASFAPPTATFTPPAGGLAGQAIGFDGSASADPSSNATSALDIGDLPHKTYAISSGIASYDWNWGDGSTADGTGATPSHTYAVDGAYTVTLTVTDDMGFTGSVSQLVVVGTPPPAVATGGASEISDQGATLNGSVNPYGESGTYRFVYGTSPTSLDSSTPDTATPAGTATTAVSATIAGLQPSTTYDYRLDVTIGGQVYSGSVQSFTTSPLPQQQTQPPPPTQTQPPPPAPTQSQPPPPPTQTHTQRSTPPAGAARQTPVAGTGAVTGIGTRSAVLNGTVNPGGSAPVSYRFSYGTSAASLNRTTTRRSGLRGTTAVPVRIAVGGLAPHTRYYFRLEVSLNGAVHSGSVRGFVTRAPAAAVRTGRAHANGVAVTLAGTVEPNGFATRYHFELGTTRRYGRSSPALSAGSARSWRSVSTVVGGLRAHTVYHYRLVATSLGGTATGVDRTFKTGARPAGAPRITIAVAPRQSLTRALATGLPVGLRCSATCGVSASAVTAPAGVARAAAFPITVARGSTRLRAGASGRLTLRFTPAARRRLRHAGEIRVLVSGVATGTGGSPSAPGLVYVTLSR